MPEFEYAYIAFGVTYDGKRLGTCAEGPFKLKREAKTASAEDNLIHCEIDRVYRDLLCDHWIAFAAVVYNSSVEGGITFKIVHSEPQRSRTQAVKDFDYRYRQQLSKDYVKCRLPVRIMDISIGKVEDWDVVG